MTLPTARVNLDSDDGTELAGDELLVAAGRTFNTDDIGLETGGLPAGGALEQDHEFSVCQLLRDTGGHTAFVCPCGQHRAPGPRHATITAGVVSSIGQQMACPGEGWLQ